MAVGPNEEAGLDGVRNRRGGTLACMCSSRDPVLAVCGRSVVLNMGTNGFGAGSGTVDVRRGPALCARGRGIDGVVNIKGSTLVGTGTVSVRCSGTGGWRVASLDRWFQTRHEATVALLAFCCSFARLVREVANRSNVSRRISFDSCGVGRP